MLKFYPRRQDMSQYVKSKLTGADTSFDDIFARAANQRSLLVGLNRRAELKRRDASNEVSPAKKEKLEKELGELLTEIEREGLKLRRLEIDLDSFARISDKEPMDLSDVSRVCAKCKCAVAASEFMYGDLCIMCSI